MDYDTVKICPEDQQVLSDYIHWSFRKEEDIL